MTKDVCVMDSRATPLFPQICPLLTNWLFTSGPPPFAAPPPPSASGSRLFARRPPPEEKVKMEGGVAPRARVRSGPQSAVPGKQALR